jgi:nucleotide-binding universal stress UspA family protein
MGLVPNVLESVMYRVSKILVPVDLSDCSRAALTHALSIASQLSAKIDVLYVAEVPVFKVEPRIAKAGGSTSLHDYARETAEVDLSAFLETIDPEERRLLSTKVDTGSPRARILDHAKKGGYDLIVMGTHGRTGRAHSFAGSVAESVVREAACPVLTVREPR